MTPGSLDESKLSQEIKEMIEHMVQIPLLRYELLAGYHRFLRDEKNSSAGNVD